MCGALGLRCFFGVVHRVVMSSLSLLTRLKESTQGVHNSSDSFVSICSVLAFADERVYLDLLVQFATIFEHLERRSLKLASERNPLIRELHSRYLTFLARADATMEDIEFLRNELIFTSDKLAKVAP